MSTLLRVATLVAIIAAGLVVSYTLARLGEPTSEWAWCSVLKDC